MRRREPSWKDEVRERVQKRRKGKTGDLPLFDTQATPPTAPLEVAEPAPGPSSEAEPELRPEVLTSPGPSLLGEAPPLAEPAQTLALDASQVTDAPTAPEPDLALRRNAAEIRIVAAEADAALRLARSGPAFDEAVAEPEQWAREVDSEPPPVERPAGFADRLEAGVVDVGLLLALYGIVLYFASRTAQAQLGALFGAWPWLVGYLAFLGLAYAVWFTGTTGQTPGKMLLGLRVVERTGQPPGYARALARAACGAVSSVFLGLGVWPLFFDPARRALHDRLFRTRVVKF